MDFAFLTTSHHPAWIDAKSGDQLGIDIPIETEMNSPAAALNQDFELIPPLFLLREPGYSFEQVQLQRSM